MVTMKERERDGNCSTYTYLIAKVGDDDDKIGGIPRGLT